MTFYWSWVSPIRPRIRPVSVVEYGLLGKSPLNMSPACCGCRFFESLRGALGCWLAFWVLTGLEYIDRELEGPRLG